MYHRRWACKTGAGILERNHSSSPCVLYSFWCKTLQILLKPVKECDIDPNAVPFVYLCEQSFSTMVVMKTDVQESAWNSKWHDCCFIIYWAAHLENCLPKDRLNHQIDYMTLILLRMTSSKFRYNDYFGRSHFNVEFWNRVATRTRLGNHCSRTWHFGRRSSGNR